MLTVWFGHDFDANLRHEELFNNCFKEEWLNSEIVKKMVKDIDKSDVLSPYCIDSPFLGQIPPERLSGGVKGLMLMMFRDNFYTDLIIFGENCCKWLAEISKLKDIRCSMSGSCLFFNGVKSIDGYCENDGRHFTNNDEWTDILFDNCTKHLERGKVPKIFIEMGIK